MPRMIRASVMAVLLIAPVPLAAIERGPLPVLDLMTIDGNRATTSQVAMEGTWLMLYVQPGCEPCEAILKAAAQHENPGLVDRLILVVRTDTREDVEALAARHPRIARMAWYADKDSALSTRLGLSGVPVVIGLRGRTIEWSLAGVLADARAIGSVLGSWILRP